MFDVRMKDEYLGVDGRDTEGSIPRKRREEHEDGGGGGSLLIEAMWGTPWAAAAAAGSGSARAPQSLTPQAAFNVQMSVRTCVLVHWHMLEQRASRNVTQYSVKEFMEAITNQGF